MTQPNQTYGRTGLEIAVIGMAGRFPGAGTIAQFWENLKNGIESMAFFTDEELKEAGLTPSLIGNPHYVRVKGLLEDVEYFDASFFGYMPVDAELMDIQMRVFHECAWEALENAGYQPDTYKGITGIYAGASSSFFWEAQTFLSGKNNLLGSFAANHLVNRDFLSSRIAYKLNLKGPAVTLQTACSTSLVAIHLASQGLLSGECDMSLAGGACISPLRYVGYLYQEGMMNSPDGHCRAFDREARGLTIGEGVGIVVLKRLEDALGDGDYIHALVTGSAINNDGTEKIGYTTPSIEGQADAISAALRMASAVPETIGYIETHGTGTELGDPVEIEALKLAFKTHKKGFCAIGSVKTNIGHLDSAAGVAGFIKTVLILKYRFIPPTLFFNSPNPKINFIDSPFYVNSQAGEWEKDDQASPMRAGVSSFGIGGTNAHVILEEAPANHRDKEGTRGLAPLINAEISTEYQLILLSAKTPLVLEKMTDNLLNYLQHNPKANLADVAYTLKLGRKSFTYRRMFQASTIPETIEALSPPGTKKINANTFSVNEEDPPVVFLFPGQDSQHEYVNMGLDLYKTEPVFRQEMDRCFEILKPLMGYDIKEILYPGKGRAQGAERSANKRHALCAVRNAIDQTQITPSLLFVIEYALAKLLVTWGIQPYAVMGHGIGEYAAACLADVFSPEDALKLITRQRQTSREIKELAPGDNHLKLKPPDIPYVSAVTGTWITTQEAVDHRYWQRSLQEKAKLIEGMNELLKKENTIFVEIGPSSIFSTALPRHTHKKPGPTILNFIKRTASGESHLQLLETMGQLWLQGKNIDWGAYYSHENRQRIPLPTYPFEPQHYNIKADLSGTDHMFSSHSHPSPMEKKKEMNQWFYIPTWTRGRPLVPKPGNEPEPRIWLVFNHGHPLGALLVNRLKKDGDRVIVVKPGPGFSKEGKAEGINKVSQEVFIINEKNKNDYDMLLQDLLRNEIIPRGILHLWTITGTSAKAIEQSPLQRLEESMDRGFYSLFYLAKAIGNQGFTELLQITVVTDNMYEITGEEVVLPEKATVLGPVKVIPIEYPNINCSNIDIIPPPPGSKQEQQMIEHLVMELRAQSPEEVIAYRGSRRWEQTFKPVYLNESPAGVSMIKKEGVYLITGGLGAIGMVLAEDLVKTARARLVLTGRTPFPPREKWGKWLETHEENNSISLKIKKLHELEKLGGTCLVFSVDAAEKKSMEDVITRAEKQLGPINGIIHSAGVPDGAVIQRRTREMTEQVLAPKVKGTLVLDSIFNHRETRLDFFVCFSSLNSFLPEFGQVGHCAANAFLDAFALHKYQQADSNNPHLVVSINWGGWQEVGQAAEAAKRFERPITSGILAAEGIEAFRRILQDHLPQVLISPHDFNHMLEQNKQDTLKKDPGMKVEEEDSTQKVLKPRPLLKTKYEAPTNPLEQALAETWQKFFGYAQVGSDDDFFDLGGDSLRVIALVDRIHKKFKVNVPLAEVFSRPTIKKLSEYIRHTDKTLFSPITSAERKEYYALSSAQVRLYILQQMDDKLISYNMPQVVMLEGQTGKENLEHCFIKLINRHESLRTSIEMIEEKPVQRVHDEVEFEIEYDDAKRKAQSAKRKEECHAPSAMRYASTIKNFVRPFDLSHPPQLRVGLIKLEPQKHILMVDMHHIASDGISNTIFIKEFMALQSGEELPPVTLQYRDYSEWYNREKNNLQAKKQADYWLREFQGKIPVLELPTDYERPELHSFEGNNFYFLLEKEKTQELRKFALKQGVTIYMVLISIFYVLLVKLTGQEDIIIGTPTAGRRQEDLQQTMGMFVNTLALRNYPQKKKTFSKFLNEVKTRSLEAFQNQDYPLEDLVEKLSLQGDASRNPLFDIVFSLDILKELPEKAEEIKIPGLSLRPFYHEHKVSKFDLSLSSMELDKKITFDFEYCTRLFKQETIRQLSGYYINILDNVVENPGVTISQIQIISDEEQIALKKKLQKKIRIRNHHHTNEKNTLPTPQKEASFDFESLG